MNLNTIAEVKRPTSADQITQWRDGYAWLAGGTWLFSEPQISTDTLIDLERLNWPALGASPAGLDIAATCRVAELYRSPVQTSGVRSRSCASAAMRGRAVRSRMSLRFYAKPALALLASTDAVIGSPVRNHPNTPK